MHTCTVQSQHQMGSLILLNHPLELSVQRQPKTVFVKCIENNLQATQSTFCSLEMHFRRRCKICICSAILGQLESFRNCKVRASEYYCPENFRCNLKFYESNNFSDSSFHHIFESEKFRIPFSTKNSLTWGSEMQKIKLKKMVGNIENCTRTKRSSRNFQPSSSYRKFQAICASPNRYFTENSLWVPLSVIAVLCCLFSSD